MKMLITNNETEPISASLVEGDANVAQDSSKILVTLLENPYIAPGGTGEVSVQFSAICDGNSISTAPIINTYSYKVFISKEDAITNTYVYDLITYDNDTTANSMPTKGFNYYIEFGDNHIN